MTALPRVAGPYSSVVRAGDFLVCSGQLGAVDGVLADGLSAQVRQAVANVASVLGTEGATLDDVVKTTVFMVDIVDFDAMNDAYLEAFGDRRPARTAVAVRALPLGAVVEIEAWAFLPSS
ncbi:MAG: endoribonuclease [Acidimicrobiaceae bacterium]|nr:endoribonuclease [Acidimicrobiaceae bacterium]